MLDIIYFIAEINDIIIKHKGPCPDLLSTKHQACPEASLEECNCPIGIIVENDKTCLCQKPIEVEETKEKKNEGSECNCPHPSPPQPPVDVEEYLRYLRQIKSELTQSNSGFKLEIASKSNSDESFDGDLKHYAEQKKSLRNDSCKCNCDGDESQNKYKIKAYPKPKDSTTSKTEGMTGITVRVKGKGSGSKALKGFLCFDLYGENNMFKL